MTNQPQYASCPRSPTYEEGVRGPIWETSLPLKSLELNALDVMLPIQEDMLHCTLTMLRLSASKLCRGSNPIPGTGTLRTQVEPKTPVMGPRVPVGHAASIPARELLRLSRKWWGRASINSWDVGPLNSGADAVWLELCMHEVECNDIRVLRYIADTKRT